MDWRVPSFYFGEDRLDGRPVGSLCVPSYYSDDFDVAPTGGTRRRIDRELMALADSRSPEVLRRLASCVVVYVAEIEKDGDPELIRWAQAKQSR